VYSSVKCYDRFGESSEYKAIISKKPTEKVISPVNSWKKPCATFCPYQRAKMPLPIMRRILLKKAIGIVENTNKHLFQKCPLRKEDRSVPSIRYVTRDRMPLQASTTSIVKLENCRMFPSWYVGIPTLCSRLAETVLANSLRGFVRLT